MEGYGKVARFMGRQDEYAIFRRFRMLNAQNLLFLQAELTHLEAELFSLVQQNSSNRLEPSRDWWALYHSEETDDVEQWDKIMENREKLERYS
jgi:regulator of replication initiation timing